MRGYKPPFGWVGGKTRIADKVIALFPQHSVYVEVFAGGLSVLYAKTRSKIEIVNDIDDDLINLHRTIQRKPLALAEALERLLVSRRLFERIRDGEAEPRNSVERAAFKFYLISISFSAKCGVFAMPKVNSKVRGLWRDWVKASQRLKGVCIESLHYEKLIKNYDSAETLFYCDPPYVKCENYYLGSLNGGFTYEDHKRLAELLRGIKGKFVMSYNDCDLVRELYKGCDFYEIPHTYTINGTKPKAANEVVIVGG